MTASVGLPLKQTTPPSHFAEALAFVNQRRMPYVKLNRAVMVGAATNGAERFANDAYDDLKQRFAGKAELTAFLAWAAGQPNVMKFAAVLATIDALRNGDPVRARRYATQARHLLANDLFVQRLETLAHGGAEAAHRDLGQTFCGAPFESIETTPGGDVHFCCPAWLPVPIGNLNENSPEEIWNSPTAQEIRRSVHDGSYRFCSRVHCAVLSSGKLPLKRRLKSDALKQIAADETVVMARGPSKLNLAHDRSCTLSCPSCRTGVIKASAAEQKDMNRMADEVLLPLCKDAERIRVTASGDPFGSGHFRYVLASLKRDIYPHLDIEIQTNGVLFDERAWTSLDLAGRLALVAISMDAARETTYAVVRRGGNFSRLKDNLRFLKGRRLAGEIAALRLDFVVQAVNYQEMPEAVEMAGDYGFDRIKFQMIRNWNTFANQGFAGQDIGSPAHPDYRRFLDVLRHPVMKSGRIEFWGMSRALQDAAG